MNIDIIIFVGFLVINLILGLFSSRNIKTIQEYAIGNRNFSTATIAATLVATWVSGDTFFTQLSEIYSSGLYFVWAQFGEVVCFLLIAYCYAPRMARFLGKLSIAEAMGDLYGQHVRFITAIAGVIGAGGMIAMQLKVAGLLFEYSFNLPNLYGIIIGGVIVTLYSSLGGIKSVTFTDIMQLFTFCTIIPTIAFFILSSLDNIDIVINTITTSSLFNYKEVFDFSRPKSLYYLFLFIFIAIPGFNPAIFQRIAMAKDVYQVRQSFVIAAITCMFVTAVTFWIGTLVLSIQPTLDANDIVTYILSHFAYIGLRGLILAGIMAMVMSTADSYINSTAVLFVHDLCTPLKINIAKNELIFARIASLFMGVLAIILALRNNNLLQLLIFANIFYMPIVTVPFTMAIFGFRTSSKSVLIGIGAGLITVILWEIFFHIGEIDALIPGMIANFVFLVGSHYLLKQTGGFVGIENDTPLKYIRVQRRRKFRNFINSIYNFNFATFLYKNSLKNDAMYTYFGLFCIISIYSIVHTIPKSLQLAYPGLINFIGPSVLFLATILISYPLWLAKWKKTNMIAIVWNISLFYILICVGFLLVIISHFAQLQLMAFMVNLIVIAVLVRWQWALFMMITGFILTMQFFKIYLGIDHLPEHFIIAEFEAVYIILLVSSILMIFLKPQQEAQEISEFIKNSLDQESNEKQLALIKLSQHRDEFISRLDKYCIGIFKSIHQQLNNLRQELPNKDTHNLLDKKQIITIIDKLNVGAEYLDQVIAQVKDSTKIHPVKISIEKFIDDVITEYKHVYNAQALKIEVVFKTTVHTIELDPILFKKVLTTYIHHGIKNATIIDIAILAEDTELEYKLSSTQTIKREAIKLSILSNNVTLEQQNIDQILQPTFNTADQLNFVETYKIITAHYGRINIKLNNLGQVAYEITIPSRLKEIRPKKMDLPDRQLDEMKAQNILMSNNKNKILRDIARQLIEINMDFLTIAKITKLPIEELKQLNIKV